VTQMTSSLAVSKVQDDATAQLHEAAPEVCVVVPTFNECDNVAVLVERLDHVLAGLSWEVVFVDDASTDGTAARVMALGTSDRRVRCIRRVGRRGLSSACIEGMLSTTAALVAVIDGDLQHDEELLPLMRDTLLRDDVDVVVASRYVGAGAADGLSQNRKRLSQVGAQLARRILKSDIADPVSGFFMLRRPLVDRLAPDLSGVGTKILIDILASSPQPLHVVELPYRFRDRHAGESKLDTLTGVEYILLLAEKFSRGQFPHRLLLFGLVGASGVIVNLAVLRILMLTDHIAFTPAQAIGTGVAMLSNFLLNNSLTYRDCRLRGWQMVRGFISFAVWCSLGALTSVAVAHDLYDLTNMWLVAGLGGAIVGALLNYALTSIFTWRRGN
jgi:dolichol-phosphate mannosyltransferase